MRQADAGFFGRLQLVGHRCARAEPMVSGFEWHVRLQRRARECLGAAHSARTYAARGPASDELIRGGPTPGTTPRPIPPPTHDATGCGPPLPGGAPPNGTGPACA